MDQQLKPKNSDTFYVIPSISNVVITENGKFLDLVLQNKVSIWDLEKGHCEKIINGPKNQLFQIAPFTPPTQSNSENQNFVSKNSYFQLFPDKICLCDIETETILQELPISTPILHFQNQDCTLAYLNDNQHIVYIPNFLTAPETQITIKPKKMENEQLPEKITLLQNKNLVYYSESQEQIFLIDFLNLQTKTKKIQKNLENLTLDNNNNTNNNENSSNNNNQENIQNRKLSANINQSQEQNVLNYTVKQLPHSGDITCVIALEGDKIAIGHKQSVHIFDTTKCCIKDMLKGYPDEYLSLCYLQDKNQLITGNSQAGIKIWDLKKCRVLSKFGDPTHYRYTNLIIHNNELISLNKIDKQLHIWNIEDYKNVTLVKFLQGGLRYLDKAIQITDSIVAFYGSKGVQNESEMSFQQILEVVNIKTGQFLFSTVIDEDNYKFDLDSLMFYRPENALFYQLKSLNIHNKDLLCFQLILGNQELKKIDFCVEDHQKSYFFPFGRIVIPYNSSIDPSMIFGPGYNNIKLQQKSGISVYDFNVKQKFSHQFPQYFIPTVIEMLDQNNLLFINQENKIEYWDLQKNQLIQKVETHPNIYIQIKHIDKFMFMFEKKKEEFVLCEGGLELEFLQRRKAKKDLKKIQLLGEDCIILYGSGILEIWNVETGEFRDSKLNFSVLDFLVSKENILLLGNGFIQVSDRSKL